MASYTQSNPFPTGREAAEGSKGIIDQARQLANVAQTKTLRTTVSV